MGRVVDGLAARDEHPTHMLPHPSLHWENTGTLRVIKHVQQRLAITLNDAAVTLAL
jgi:hypothetical protein